MFWAFDDVVCTQHIQFTFSFASQWRYWYTAVTTATWNMHGVINTISMVSCFVSRKMVIYKQNTEWHIDRADIIRFWWSCHSAFVLVCWVKWTHHLFRSYLFFTHKSSCQGWKIFWLLFRLPSWIQHSNNSFCHHFTAIEYHYYVRQKRPIKILMRCWTKGRKIFQNQLQILWNVWYTFCRIWSNDFIKNA